MLALVCYGLVVYYALRPAATHPWQQSLPQILLSYPQLAKAAMVVAVGSHCWSLAGISQVANGAWPNPLSPQRRAALRRAASQAAWRVVVVAGLSTGFWMLAYGLTLGVTWWAWVLSGGLFILFTAQARILNRQAAMASILMANSVQLPASMLGIGERARTLYRPAEAWAVAASMAWPVAANLLGGLTAAVPHG